MPRVAGDDADAFVGDAKRLGGHLGQHGEAALAHVHDAGRQRHRAVVLEGHPGDGPAAGAAAVDEHAHAHAAPYHGAGVRRVGPALAPADGRRAAFEALAQSVAGERHAAFHRLGVHHLVEGRYPLARLALGAHVVLQPEVQRVDAQLLGDPVHQRLEGEVALRRAEGAVGAGGGLVCVDQVAVVAGVGAAVQVQRALSRAADDARPGGEVRSGVHDRGGVHGGHRAVVGDAHPELGGRCVSVAARDELLLAGQFDLDRPVGATGQDGGDGGQPGLVLVAVAGAHVGADDAHVLLVGCRARGTG